MWSKLVTYNTVLPVSASMASFRIVWSSSIEESAFNCFCCLFDSSGDNDLGLFLVEKIILSLIGEYLSLEISGIGPNSAFGVSLKNWSPTSFVNSWTLDVPNLTWYLSFGLAFWAILQLAMIYDLMGHSGGGIYVTRLTLGFITFFAL